MKYILSFIGLVIIVCAIFFCGQNQENTISANEEYIRIHITANSSSTQDQNIKYEVKDAVVDFLIPLLAEAENKNKANQIICLNVLKIQEVANQVLRKKEMKYNAVVTIVQEEMPTRAYDDFVLEEGIYDSLKIDLGEAKGDNWWCVVFPAVCFISSKNYENYDYISKIWDIISNVTQKT